MKIIQVVNQLSCGGAETLVSLLHEQYLGMGLDACVVSLTSSENQLTREGFHILPFASPNALSLVWVLSKKLRSLIAIDEDVVIHSHLTQSQCWTAIVGVSLRRLLKKKFNLVLVTTEHDTSNRRRDSWIGWIFDRLLYSAYDRIICISQGVELALNQWMPTVRMRTEVVYNGLQLKKFWAIADKRKVSLLLEPCIIISIGRLEYKKGLDLALEACTQMLGENFEYWIIGQGSEEDSLKNLISSYDLNTKVRLLGHKEDISYYLSKADIFLMPSRWEGFGLSLLEAMASGLPSVVSNVPGITELSTDCCSLFFISENVNDLEEKIRLLLRSSKLRKELGEQAQKRSQRFSIDKMASAYVQSYKNLLDSSPEEGSAV